MQTSNNGADPQELQGLPEDVAAAVGGMWAGSRGATVRCVPTRRTMMVRVPAGRVLFGKLRQGRARDARAEWHWLHVLPLLGLRVPRAIAHLRRGRRSLLVTEALPGRALDAWFAAAANSGTMAAVARYAIAQIAPLLADMHRRGIVFRDLYWNHLFATDLASPPAMLDVERVFRPRWRQRRWRVKDLAGLLASLPVRIPAVTAFRFLAAYLGESPRRHRKLVEAIVRKARRIARHRPRYG